MAFFLYFMVCEAIVTVTDGTLEAISLTFLTIAQLFFVFIKDEQWEENAKLIEISCLTVILSSFLVLYIMLVFKITVELYAFLLLQPFLVAGVLQIKPYSLRF